MIRPFTISGNSVMVALCLLFLLHTIIALPYTTYTDDELPPFPFTEIIQVTRPPTQHKNVLLLQKLLNRISPPDEQTDENGIYTKDTAVAVSAFKARSNLSPIDVVFDFATAKELLYQSSRDNYIDQWLPAKHYNLLYKIHVPVYQNRSIETMATLYDDDNNLLHEFKVRAKGHTDNPHDPNWPVFEDKTDGLTQFASNGATPTGIMYIDLNTPEPDAYVDLYGPYPVNRIVQGIGGNAEILIPNYRNGILLHTGAWDKHGWDTSKPMPNSSGCLHAHPNDVKIIADILQHKLGVVANENPLGKLPYPFKPQGLLVVQQMD